MSNGSGIICTPEEIALSRNPHPTIHCLTRGESIGLALSAESGFISLVAVTILFLLIIRNVYRHWKYSPSGQWRLLQEPTDIYMLSLFISDLIQALGYTVDVRWVHEGKVFAGTFCTAQGALQQLGEVGVALATLAIAIHTFVTVIWRKGIHSRAVAFTVVGIIWLFIALFVGIGIGTHGPDDHYMVPTPYWCWIGDRYGTERIVGEYMWLWISLFSSFLVYVPLYFWSTGNLSVDIHKWWKFRIHRQVHVQDCDGRRRRAFGMLAYPLVYSVTVLPLSIVRWIGFSRPQGDIPSAATFIVVFIYTLSGAMNVFLLLYTRPRLLLFGAPKFASEPSGATRRKRVGDQDMESGHSQAPIQLGRLNDDMGWNLPSGRESTVSTYSARDAT